MFGYIFNVTSGGEEFYFKNNTYGLFVGHECTRSIALASLETEDLDLGLDDLMAIDVRE